MSEHQYYEFQAIDRPLDAAAQRALRQLSSRATITDRSFVNEYDLALALLKDLAHLADRDGERATFDQRLYAFRERHRGKAFLTRLDSAGLVVKLV